MDAMAKRKRDYKAEYRRRLKRGKKKGLSRSQSRGHPRAKEKYIAPKRRKPPSEKRLQKALILLSRGKPLADSARAAGITPEKFRHFITRKKIARKSKGHWVLLNKWPREMRFFSEGKIIKVILPNQKSAVLVGTYLAAVKQFLETNNPAVLEPFKEKSVTDKAKKTYPFETDPNILYQLNTASAEPFEQVYRLVI